MNVRLSAFALCFAALGPSAAWACSCIPLRGSPMERVQAQAGRVEHIFTADVEAARYDERRDVVMQVRVTERLKGEAPEALEILTPGPQNSCGGEFGDLPARPQPAYGAPLARITIFTNIDASGRGFYGSCTAVGIHAPREVYEAFFDELRAAR